MTFEKITKKLGISPNDIVRYHRHGKTAIIEIDIENPEKKNNNNKNDSIFNLGQNPVSTGLSDGSVNHDKYIYNKNK
jgi:hypothetical protein